MSQISMRGRIGAIIFAVAVVGIIGMAVWSGISDARAASAPHEVIYSVKGTATEAMVTYTNEQGGMEQRTVALPWELSLTVQRGDSLYISAQNQGETGDVKLSIWLDGHPYKTSTSSGEYAIAEASASCP